MILFNKKMKQEKIIKNTKKMIFLKLFTNLINIQTLMR